MSLVLCTHVMYPFWLKIFFIIRCKSYSSDKFMKQNLALVEGKVWSKALFYNYFSETTKYQSKKAKSG